MSSPTTASELSRIINQLRVDRQAHLDAIAEIDHTFKDFGIAAGEAAAAAPKASKAKAEPAPAPAPVAEAAPAPAPAPAPAAAPAAKGKKKGPAKAAKAAKGAKAAKAAKPAKPAKAAKAPKETKAAKVEAPAAAANRRGKFAISGEQLILDFVKAKGGATTEEIRKHWQAAGRKGKAENKLTDLVKSGQLKRNKVKGKIGSTYTMP